MSYADTIKRSWNDNRLMSVLLELTYACNLDCTFCYNDASLDGKPLSLHQYRELLDDLASLGVLNLSLSGGEPLAHPQFFDIATHARSLGFVIRLKTNGHAMRATMARRVREEVDPFLVEVSIHGATAATHDRQTRVAGSFERLQANIAAMKAVGLRVRANSVLTRWNEHEVSDMLALCDRMGVACQIDAEVKPRDDGDQSPLRIEATPEGQASYRRALVGHAKRDAQVTEIPSAADARQETMNGTDKHCGAGSNTIAIDPFGAVLPCVQWRVAAGNLHEAGSPKFGRTQACFVRSERPPVPHDASSRASGTQGWSRTSVRVLRIHTLGTRFRCTRRRSSGWRRRVAPAYDLLYCSREGRSGIE